MGEGGAGRARRVDQLILDVAGRLEEEGDGLYEWAKENPDDFWTKLFKAAAPKSGGSPGSGGDLPECGNMSDEEIETRIALLLQKAGAGPRTVRFLSEDPQGESPAGSARAGEGTSGDRPGATLSGGKAGTDAPPRRAGEAQKEEKALYLLS